VPPVDSVNRGTAWIIILMNHHGISELRFLPGRMHHSTRFRRKRGQHPEDQAWAAKTGGPVTE